MRPISNHLIGLVFVPKEVQKPLKHSNICTYLILGLNMTSPWTIVRNQMKLSPN